MVGPRSDKGGARKKRPRAASPTLDRPTAPPPTRRGSAPSGSAASGGAPAGTRFDDLVDYREELGDDFDALASEHPRSSVLIALAAGIALGFLLGALAVRGNDG